MLFIAIGGEARATIVFEYNGGSGNHYNLIGNGSSPLISDGPVVEGYVNMMNPNVNAVVDIGSVDATLSLKIEGGQAMITEISSQGGGPNQTFFSSVYFMPHAANDRSPDYVPMFSFSDLEFELGFNPSTGPDGSKIKITVNYGATGVATFEKPQPFEQPARFRIIGNAGEQITKVTVESLIPGITPGTFVTGKYLSEIKQIRLGGVNTTDSTIDDQGDIVPEPTSLALAGFAGIGMAVSALRRRRQAKTQVA